MCSAPHEPRPQGVPVILVAGCSNGCRRFNSRCSPSVAHSPYAKGAFRVGSSARFIDGNIWREAEGNVARLTEALHLADAAQRRFARRCITIFRLQIGAFNEHPAAKWSCVDKAYVSSARVLDQRLSRLIDEC